MGEEIRIPSVVTINLSRLTAEGWQDILGGNDTKAKELRIQFDTHCVDPGMIILPCGHEWGNELLLQTQDDVCLWMGKIAQYFAHLRHVRVDAIHFPPRLEGGQGSFPLDSLVPLFRDHGQTLVSLEVANQLSVDGSAEEFFGYLSRMEKLQKIRIPLRYSGSDRVAPPHPNRILDAVTCMFGIGNHQHLLCYSLERP